MSPLLALPILLGLLQSTAAAPAEPVRPALQRFVVDPEMSELGFDGSSTLHDFTARTHEVAGEVRFDPAHLALAGGSIACKAATLDSGSEGRDEDMRETLEVERFPEIRFTLASTTGAWSAAKCRLAITGRFAIHGVEREAKLDVDVAGRPDGGLSLAGKVKLSLDDFELDPPSVLFVTMDDEVEVGFDLVLLPAKGEWKPAVSRPLELVEERLDEKGTSLGRTTENGRLWIDGKRLLWERPSAAQWIVVARVKDTFALDLDRGLQTTVLDLASGRRIGKVATAEEAFKEAGQEAPNLSLRAREWIRFEGLKGDGTFAWLLLAAPGLPQEVREELFRTVGTPDSVRFTTIDPRGSWKRELRLGPEQEGLVPAFAFDFETWLAEEP